MTVQTLGDVITVQRIRNVSVEGKLTQMSQRRNKYSFLFIQLQICCHSQILTINIIMQENQILMHI